MHQVKAIGSKLSVCVTGSTPPRATLLLFLSLLLLSLLPAVLLMRSSDLLSLPPLPPTSPPPASLAPLSDTQGKSGEAFPLQSNSEMLSLPTAASPSSLWQPLVPVEQAAPGAGTSGLSIPRLVAAGASEGALRAQSAAGEGASVSEAADDPSETMRTPVGTEDATAAAGNAPPTIVKAGTAGGAGLALSMPSEVGEATHPTAQTSAEQAPAAAAAEAAAATAGASSSALPVPRSPLSSNESPSVVAPGSSVTVHLASANHNASQLSLGSLLESYATECEDEVVAEVSPRVVTRALLFLTAAVIPRQDEVQSKKFLLRAPH